MPSYDYRCTHCGSEFEAIHGISRPAPLCPRCGEQARQVFLTAPAVHGRMARGREEAARTLEPKSAGAPHGPGCPCCH